MNAIPFIDLTRQQEQIRPELDRRMKDVLLHAQFIMGPEVAELEQKLAHFVGVNHCVCVASGTDALMIALMALGVGPGDEVVTTPFTFIATGETIMLLGAKPVFVDIDPRTYNLDPALLEGALTPKTKAIIPVSLYGQCADFDAIAAIAAPRGIPVIEDGCQSFGATYKKTRSCALSTVGCTSFFPSKPLGCYGDAGACFTDDEAIATRMKQIRVHGQDRRYHHPVLGINGRMDTLQAAILLAKLEVFQEEVWMRAQIGASYTAALKDHLQTPFIEPHNTSVYAQYTVEVENRTSVQERLRNRGIPSAVHYPVPLHMQPVFAGLGLKEGDFPLSESAARRVMSLPMHPYLTQDEIGRVCKELRSALG